MLIHWNLLRHLRLGSVAVTNREIDALVCVRCGKPIPGGTYIIGYGIICAECWKSDPDNEANNGNPPSNP